MTATLDRHDEALALIDRELSVLHVVNSVPATEMTNLLLELRLLWEKRG